MTIFLNRFVGHGLMANSGFLLLFLGVTAGGCKSRTLNGDIKQSNTGSSNASIVKGNLTGPCKGEAIASGNALECKADNEPALIEEAKRIAIDLITEGQAKEKLALEKAKNASSKTGSEKALFKRDAHAKHHGCVKGTFTVAENIDSVYAPNGEGLFSKPGESFKIWSRFSNAGLIDGTNDEGFDVRGMAIKVIGGTKGKDTLDGSSKSSLDLLLVNIPFFLAKDIADYNKQLTVAKTAKKNPLQAASDLFQTQAVAKVIAALKVSKMKNPLGEKYFSISHSLLGENAVSYKIESCTEDKPGDEGQVGPDKFKLAMAQTLSKNSEVCFALSARYLKIRSWKMIEDVSLDWEEHVKEAMPNEDRRRLSRDAKKQSDEISAYAVESGIFSEWSKVAQVTFPKQEFQDPKQMDFCENISFSPWRTVENMRPLGTLNRARKEVYETVASTRRSKNSASTAEPTGEETFP